MPRYEDDPSPPLHAQDRRPILPPPGSDSRSSGRMRAGSPPLPPTHQQQQQPLMHPSSRRSHRDPDPRDYSPGAKPHSSHYRDYDDMYPPPPPAHQHVSRQPMPYKILCVANLNSKVSDGSIRDALIREFTRFGDVSVKVTHDANERFAYIYFRCYEDAREARHAKSRMILFDKAVEIDPIYERSVVSSSSSTSRSRRSITPDYGPPPSSHSSSRRPVSPLPHSRPTRPYPSSSSSSGRLVDRHGVPYSISSSSRHQDYVRDHHQHNHHPVPRDDYPVRSSGTSNHHSVSAGSGNGNNNNSSNNNGAGRDSSTGSGSNRDKSQRDAKKEKFPNYLHHIPPEEDDKATRTLFVGNLEVSISEPDLKRIFERYGTVEDIDVKRPPPGQGNAYAFIKYQNLDMAHRSKVEMSGQYIGKFQCKIGYGKATPTTRIWVGGLGSWTSLSALEREFDRFGAIRKIDFVRGDNHAYISYDSIDAAQAACQEMRGFPMGGQDKRLRVDFADPGPYNSFDGTSSPVVLPSSPSAGDSVLTSSATAVSRVVLPGEKFVDPETGTPVVRTFVPADTESEGRPHDGRISHRSSGLSDPSPDATAAIAGDRSNGNSLTGGWSDVDADRMRADRKSRSIHSPDNLPPAKRVRECELMPASGRTTSASSADNNGVSVKSESVDDARSILVSESVTCLPELVKCCPSAWTGALILKNSAFPTKMLLCSGDVSLVHLLMKTTDHPPPPHQQHPSSSPAAEATAAPVPVLRITQRLRLDESKLDDVSRRMSAAGSQGHCMLLATRQPTANCAQFSGSKVLGEDGNEVVQRPLKNLVHYLKQKQAAGVIPLTSSPNHHPSSGTTTSAAGKEVRGSLYAFPPCPFAFDLVHKIAPNFVDSENSKEEYLIILLIRGYK